MLIWRSAPRSCLNFPSSSVFPNLIFSLCHKDGNKSAYPEEPTTCCMSGCANCVWIEYAQKLSDYYKDGGEEALKQINEKVTDPNMKAFLLHELRMRKNK